MTLLIHYRNPGEHTSQIAKFESLKALQSMWSAQRLNWADAVAYVLNPADQSLIEISPFENWVGSFGSKLVLLGGKITRVHLIERADGLDWSIL